MSTPWIAFYPGDYLKKTQALTTEQHGAYLLLLIECWTKGALPKSEAKRAKIVRVSIGRYRRKVAPLVATYFTENGTNKRASEEVEKAEKLYLNRSLAGAKGGTVAASKRQASASRNARNDPSIKLKQTSTNQKEEDITSSLPSAARETAAVENKGQPRKEGKQAKHGLKTGEIVGPEVLPRVWGDK